MRIVRKAHFPKAKLGDFVKLDGYTYKVIAARGEEDFVLVVAPGRDAGHKAGHKYEKIKTQKAKLEELQKEEDMRERMAEEMDIDFEIETE